MYTNNFTLPPSSSGKETSKSTTVAVKEALQHIYSDIWVECVIRSPLYRPGELIVGGADDSSGGKLYLVKALLIYGQQILSANLMHTFRKILYILICSIQSAITSTADTAKLNVFCENK